MFKGGLPVITDNCILLGCHDQGISWEKSCEIVTERMIMYLARLCLVTYVHMGSIQMLQLFPGKAASYNLVLAMMDHYVNMVSI